MLQLGPLAMAADRAAAVLAIWAFVGIGGLVASRADTKAGRVSWVAAGVGIVAARIGYVLENLSAYLVEPWTMLALWQGGFSPWAGVAAAAATVVAMLGRQRAGVVLIGALAALWMAHGALTALTAPATRAMPDGIALATVDGQSFRLDSLRGQPFVLNLWATWCPPCRREMPMLVDVAQSSTVPILLVNQGETAGQVKEFLSDNRLPGESVALDTTQRVAAATRARAYPTTVFVDADGKIVGVHAGEISRAALTAAIRDLERTM